MSEAGDKQERVITSLGGMAIVAGSMLGIGIFLTPPQVAAHMGSVGGYLLVWLLGGVIAISGAVAYAELGTRFPEAGGDYVFLREAFGAPLSFAAGWLLFFGVFTGSVATMAVPRAEFQLPVLLEPVMEIDPHQPLVGWGWLELTVARAIGIGLIAVLTAINILGTKLSTGMQIALTGAPVVLLGLGALGLLIWHPGVEDGSLMTSDGEGGTAVGMGRAILAVYFAYAGWNAIAYVGGEMQHPGSSIPRSLLGGTALITLLYLLLAGSFVYVLGMEGLEETLEAGTATAMAVAEGPGAYGVTALIAVALVGSLNGTILVGGRVGWAMAKKGSLSDGVGELSDRFGTPARALILQGGLALILVMTGTFEMLLEMTSIAMFVMSGLTVWALFRIRKRDGAHAPYQAAGYPWLPLLFLAISVAVVLASIYRATTAGFDAMAESVFPLMGLALFLGLWMAREGWDRLRA